MVYARINQTLESLYTCLDLDFQQVLVVHIQMSQIVLTITNIRLDFLQLLRVDGLQDGDADISQLLENCAATGEMLQCLCLHHQNSRTAHTY